MKPSEQLKAAKALIDKESTWTQGRYARDAEDKAVLLYSPAACKFCSLGAANRASKNTIHASDDMLKYLIFAAKDSIANFNDTHSHWQVMRMWDEAIEMAEIDENS